MVSEHRVRRGKKGHKKNLIFYPSDEASPMIFRGTPLVECKEEEEEEEADKEARNHYSSVEESWKEEADKRRASLERRLRSWERRKENWDRREEFERKTGLGAAKALCFNLRRRKAADPVS